MHYIKIVIPIVSLNGQNENAIDDIELFYIGNNSKIIEPPIPPYESTLEKLNTLNPDIQLDDTGSCPEYDPVTKTIRVTAAEGTKSLLCEAEDDYGVSYYFRGNVQNNYVSFANAIWRIVRINGDGSIRLIYDGAQAYANTDISNGANRQIGTSAYNTSYNDNAYVGYMYKGVNQSSYANTFDVMNNKSANSSIIKGVIDSWYEQNITADNLQMYVSDNVFCNNKNIVDPALICTNNSYCTYNQLGYGKNNTAYRWANYPFSTYEKLKFTCVNTQGSVNSKNDAYTVSDTIHGNGALAYPAALITTDEAAAAGAFKLTGNNFYNYLNTSTDFWTMSPSNFHGQSENLAQANVMIVTSYFTAGNMSYVYYASPGVRPVINLIPDIEFSSGNGTMSNPFVVKVS